MVNYGFLSVTFLTKVKPVAIQVEKYKAGHWQQGMAFKYFFDRRGANRTSDLRH
jgi:hypothetical protein